MRSAATTGGRKGADNIIPAAVCPKQLDLPSERAPDHKRSRSLPCFLLVTAILSVAAFVGAAGLLIVLSRAPDGAHARLADAIDALRSGFAAMAAGRAQAIAASMSRLGLFTADLDQALAPAGAPPYRHGRAYVVNTDGSLAAAYPAEESVIPPAVADLVNRFFADHGSSPVFASATPNLADITLPVDAQIIGVDDRPALAAIAAVPMLVDHDAHGRPAIVVTLTAFDADIVGALARMARIPSLRLDAESLHSGGPAFSQTDQRGRIVGWFGWDGTNPIWERLGDAWPFVGLGGVGFLGIAGWSLRRFGTAMPITLAAGHAASQSGREDPLTHIPNRRSTIEVLSEALVSRPEDQVVALACLNIDGFKEINGALGHETGDQLLIATADRLRAAMPQSTAVGRLNGDEFAAVMTVKDTDAAVEAAQACAQALAAPFVIRDHVIQVSASIGLAQAPQDGGNSGDLIRRADLASRAAKRKGRGRILAFHYGLETEINERRFIENELRQALLDESLDVAYQPIVAGDGLSVIGAEALLRWRHPARGDIPPGIFVSVAEQTGMMIQLGKFVMRRAFDAARTWPDYYVAVNLSPVQVRDRMLVRAVADTLAETRIEPTRVVLEITEGVLIDNPEEAKQRLKDLRALGIKIALDDFGSGYSSLNYLRRLPIDKLKIDREFVSPLGRSANGGVIIEAIVTLGRALGLSVLAEGVETEEQRVLLRLAGCDELQGYLFARPMPQHALAEFFGRGAQANGHGVGASLGAPDLKAAGA